MTSFSDASSFWNPRSIREDDLVDAEHLPPAGMPSCWDWHALCIGKVFQQQTLIPIRRIAPNGPIRSLTREEVRP